jgi:hypothetical protein
MTAVEYFVFKAATVSAIATAGFSFDDDPRSILKADWPRPPPGHTTSGAVRTGEGNHEMPGLPYPAFRKVNAEPGGGKPSPYGDTPCGHRRPGKHSLCPLEPQRGDLTQPRPAAWVNGLFPAPSPERALYGTHRSAPQIAMKMPVGR